ncbi:MAG: hypothetical protein LBC51_09105, partial [Treponema sp.]|nr:hypothetical protein [Treponema sp.]
MVCDNDKNKTFSAILSLLFPGLAVPVLPALLVPLPHRATSFNFAEQNIMQEIVAEGSSEHFAADPKPFFRDASLP